MRKYNVPPIPSTIWTNPIHFIAFGFGTGALPFAPGTFGTLIAIPFYLMLANLSVPFYTLLVLIIAALSVWICEKVSKEIKIEDHQGMCLDEIVGYLVAMIGAPHGLIWIVLGFIFFRLFDIWKPWPIRMLDEKIQNGFGMILDDVLAGVYSAVILQGLFFVFVNFICI